MFVGNITHNINTKKETAIVVGASLSGLMTGISLAREGLHVTIVDKVSEEQRHGSGLQVDGGTLEMSKTARLLRKLASGGKPSLQLWSAIEHRLRKEALSDSKIDIRYHTKVDTVNQDANSAWIIIKDDETIHADILIGADGHRSIVREHVSPHKPHATYAGYIVWIVDTMDENDLPRAHRPISQGSGSKIYNGPHGFLFGSIIDNKDGAAGSGKRRLGCAWYDNTRSDLLYHLGCVKDNVVHHSLKGVDIPEETIHELMEETQGMWPEPWLSITLHALENRSLTGIPIKEYLPDNLVKKRVALVGDAAHVPAPITASGFNQSLEDAVAIGKCVSKGVKGENAFQAMEKYESQRLNKVRRIVQSGQSFGLAFGQL